MDSNGHPSAYQLRSDARFLKAIYLICEGFSNISHNFYQNIDEVVTNNQSKHLTKQIISAKEKIDLLLSQQPKQKSLINGIAYTNSDIAETLKGNSVRSKKMLKNAVRQFEISKLNYLNFISSPSNIVIPDEVENVVALYLMKEEKNMLNRFVTLVSFYLSDLITESSSHSSKLDNTGKSTNTYNSVISAIHDFQSLRLINDNLIP